MRAEDLEISDLLQMPPRGGVLRFGPNRTLLYDAVALGLLRSQLVDSFGVQVARGLLTRLGYTHGWRTAETIRDAVDWDDELEWRRAGGRLHRLQGMVRFEPVSKTRPGAVAEAVWLDSYEAEQHILHLGQAEEPVCWSLAGFASGYLTRVHGQPIYALEETCCGRGDATCHMVAKTVQAWGPELQPHLPYYEADCIDATLRDLRESVRELDRKIRARRRALGPDADVLDTGGIVARSPAMRRVLSLCRRVAAVDSTVYLRGESGVGKERIARFIHETSARAAGPFVSVNCAALPESLLESELFGHARGSFSGATADRQGLFEAAQGGTLLLDEIGDVPPSLQVRLLRVLQERQVRRLGENHDRPVDVRVLSATHRDLGVEVSAGRFRQDLYYRLKVVEIDIPPLRARPEDILPLARVKLAETASRFKREVRGLSPEASRTLAAHTWPGNVRELHNVVERAVVFAETDTIEVSDLQLDAPAEPARESPTPPPGTLAEVERTHILATLEATGGNRAEAARRLGIGVATLFRRLKRYGNGPP